MSLRDGPYLRKYHALFPNTVIICLKQLLRDDTLVRLLTDTVVRPVMKYWLRHGCGGEAGSLWSP